MKQVLPEPSWPDSWRYSYTYDRLELYGDDGNRGYTYAYRSRTSTASELIASVAAPPASVLDVAAGQGNMSLRLAELGYTVTWNDLRDDLAGYVALKHERGKIDYRPGNLFDLDGERRYDVVLLSEVVEHVAHPDALLAKAAALVAPGGHVVLTTPNGEYFRNTLPKFSDCADPSMFESEQFKPDADGHIFLLYVDEIRSMARSAGLEVRSVRLFTNPLTTGHLGTGAVLRRLPEGVVWALERATRRLPQPLSRKVNVHLAALLARGPAR
jgi:2-polyprenyl-3-methyl-5-hydroxy-6-metoxy-1,4-benzoquinol methylase